MKAVSTNAFISVSTAACTKRSSEFPSKEVRTEARGSIYFTEATSMEATFMSVWMGAFTKASMNFTRKRLPGFGCFRRTCPLNFRTFIGNGSRLSSRGSVHGSSFHGRLRGRRGYHTTSPSPSLREEEPSTEGSGIQNPWPTPMDEVRAISRTYSRVTKCRTRTHGPMRTSFHGNFHIGCTACIAA